MRKRISKEKLTKLVAKSDITIIDLRSPVAFRDGHVTGASNMTLRKFTNLLMGTADRSTPFIIYGVTENDEDVVYALKYGEQLGFSKIYATDYTTIR